MGIPRVRSVGLGIDFHVTMEIQVKPIYWFIS